jgi:hypothetical protein
MSRHNQAAAAYGSMKKIFCRWLCLLLLSGFSIATIAAPPPPETQLEVMHLLKFVQESDCQFNRNNTWHSGKDARQHLETKYDYLAKRAAVEKAEDFIEKGASESSLSGKPYQIRCADGKTIPSAQWLSEELRRFRTGVEKK